MDLATWALVGVTVGEAIGKSEREPMTGSVRTGGVVQDLSATFRQSTATFSIGLAADATKTNLVLSALHVCPHGIGVGPSIRCTGREKYALDPKADLKFAASRMLLPWLNTLDLGTFVFGHARIGHPKGLVLKPSVLAFEVV